MDNATNPLLSISGERRLLFRQSLRNGLLVFDLSLWEINNFHVFVVTEVSVPIVAVAQRGRTITRHITLSTKKYLIFLYRVSWKHLDWFKTTNLHMGFIYPN
jgi:hypothetical protein